MRRIGLVFRRDAISSTCRGEKRVIIKHDGSYFTSFLTRKGKLILAK
jgi:hemin uptake protein HemP